MDENTDQALTVTRNWVAEFVIRHNLCPFAASPFNNDRIRFLSIDVTDSTELVDRLIEEILFLMHADPGKTETSIVVTPHLFAEFSDYNQFLDIVDTIIMELQVDGIIQVASFHPQYQFADLEQDDVRNYTNRSPFPMFHLIREDSIEKARHTMDVESIPDRNMELLLQLGLEEVLKQQSQIIAKRTP